MNLLTPHFITKIHIQGTDGYFIKRFKILYSLDGYQWEYYTENKDDPNSAREFEGNHGGYDISIAYMKYPFIVSHSMNEKKLVKFDSNTIIFIKTTDIKDCHHSRLVLKCSNSQNRTVRMCFPYECSAGYGSKLN